MRRPSPRGGPPPRRVRASPRTPRHSRIVLQQLATARETAAAWSAAACRRAPGVAHPRALPTKDSPVDVPPQPLRKGGGGGEGYAPAERRGGVAPPQRTGRPLLWMRMCTRAGLARAADPESVGKKKMHRALFYFNPERRGARPLDGEPDRGRAAANLLHGWRQGGRHASRSAPCRAPARARCVASARGQGLSH